jgi:hypothetical protein
VFGVGLTRSAPWGTLTLGKWSCRQAFQFSSSELLPGAVDSTFVKNASLIGWNEVASFEPFGSESNRSSYLQWAIPMSNITVRLIYLHLRITLISIGQVGTESIQPIPTYTNVNGNRSLALIDV